MQTACNLVTASARGTNANISGKGSLWKVPSRAATSTIFPLNILFAIKFPSPTAPVGHLLTPGDNVRKELALVNPNHVILSGWRNKFMVHFGRFISAQPSSGVALSNNSQTLTRPPPGVQRAYQPKQLVAPGTKCIFSKDLCCLHAFLESYLATMCSNAGLIVALVFCVLHNQNRILSNLEYEL